jgi:Mg2+-importing ATPase
MSGSFHAKDLFVDQATLTGESAPVEKYADYKETVLYHRSFQHRFLRHQHHQRLRACPGLSDRKEQLFRQHGQIAFHGSKPPATLKTASANQQASHPLHACHGPGHLHRQYPDEKQRLDAILFSITISIGLIPEMLPVIMTSTLAKGAVEMSKKNTIVKRLSSIQTFGQMDILCTDKTGTLTQDTDRPGKISGRGWAMKTCRS